MEVKQYCEYCGKTLISKFRDGFYNLQEFRQNGVLNIEKTSGKISDNRDNLMLFSSPDSFLRSTTMADVRLCWGGALLKFH